MSQLTGPVVAAAAARAGFTGDGLVRIVAIGKRESGWDDTAQGDLSIQTGEWGPSVGVWQIRTLKADTGTGGDRDITALLGNLPRQAAASWSISGQGSNFGPWSTNAGISDADMNAAREAIAGAGKLPAAALTSSSGGSSDSGGGIAGDLVSGMDSALGGVLGFDGTFSEWLVMLSIRSLEVAGGAVLFAVALVMLIDVVGAGGSSRVPRSAGLVGRSVRSGVQLAKRAATVAAAA